MFGDNLVHEIKILSGNYTADSLLKSMQRAEWSMPPMPQMYEELAKEHKDFISAGHAEPEYQQAFFPPPPPPPRPERPKVNFSLDPTTKKAKIVVAASPKAATTLTLTPTLSRILGLQEQIKLSDDQTEVYGQYPINFKDPTIRFIAHVIVIQHFLRGKCL